MVNCWPPYSSTWPLSTGMQSNRNIWYPVGWSNYGTTWRHILFIHHNDAITRATRGYGWGLNICPKRGKVSKTHSKVPSEVIGHPVSTYISPFNISHFIVPTDTTQRIANTLECFTLSHTFHYGFFFFLFFCHWESMQRITNFSYTFYMAGYERNWY